MWRLDPDLRSYVTRVIGRWVAREQNAPDR